MSQHKTESNNKSKENTRVTASSKKLYDAQCPPHKRTKFRRLQTYSTVIRNHQLFFTVKAVRSNI